MGVGKYWIKAAPLFRREATGRHATEPNRGPPVSRCPSPPASLNHTLTHSLTHSLAHSLARTTLLSLTPAKLITLVSRHSCHSDTHSLSLVPHCHSTATVPLPLYCPSVTLLPQCHSTAPGPLPLYCHSATLLPQCPSGSAGSAARRPTPLHSTRLCHTATATTMMQQ